MTQPFHGPLPEFHGIHAAVVAIWLPWEERRAQDLDSLCREVWENPRVLPPLLHLPLCGQKSSNPGNCILPLPTQAVQHNNERLRQRMLSEEREWDGHLVRPKNHN